MKVQMQAHVGIPDEATLNDIDAVIEFLTGLARPRLDIPRRAIDVTLTIDPDEADRPMRAAVLAAIEAAGAELSVTRLAESGLADEDTMRPIVGAALRAVELVEEVNSELRSRGWHAMSVLAPNEAVA